MNNPETTIIQQLRRLNILFVDDEELLIETMQNVIPSFCKRAYFAQNGVEGLSLALKYKIDMVITDIKMPTMDGIEMVRAIKKFHPQVKTIFLTGCSDIDVSELPEMKYEFITKPINSDKLFNTIHRVI